ncbi:hypothetical protein [Streptomyces virginiae]|uniref:hypothetical protein n=1 Tax=Streptomyces virginiae TaxID=1961 RepID=UPI0036FFF7E2
MFPEAGIAIVVMFALSVAAAAGMLARLDSAGYPTAFVCAATAFAAALTLAAVVATAMAQLV